MQVQAIWAGRTYRARQETKCLPLLPTLVMTRGVREAIAVGLGFVQSRAVTTKASSTCQKIPRTELQRRVEHWQIGRYDRLSTAHGYV